MSTKIEMLFSKTLSTFISLVQKLFQIMPKPLVYLLIIISGIVGAPIALVYWVVGTIIGWISDRLTEVVLFKRYGVKAKVRNNKNINRDQEEN